MPKHNNGIAQSKKEQRREEAEARNAAWRAMPLEHQLADLDARDLKATKQRARIEAAMKKKGKGK
jgi:hypothetical protein